MPAINEDLVAAVLRKQIASLSDLLRRVEANRLEAASLVKQLRDIEFHLKEVRETH